VILLALSWPLSHPNPTAAAHQEFGRGIYLYSLQEDAAITSANDLRSLLSGNQLSERQWGKRTLAEVLPKWSLAANTVSQIDVPSDSSYNRAKLALTDYLKQYQTALSDAAEAARDNDASKAQVAKDEFAQSAVLQQQASGLLKANL
jgi:hypothetical protein